MLSSKNNWKKFIEEDSSALKCNLFWFLLETISPNSSSLKVLQNTGNSMVIMKCGQFSCFLRTSFTVLSFVSRVVYREADRFSLATDEASPMWLPVRWNRLLEVTLQKLHEKMTKSSSFCSQLHTVFMLLKPCSLPGISIKWLPPKKYYIVGF